MFNKVARITLIFWLMKIVATTLGETLGDFISMTLDFGYAAGILVTLFLFIASLLVQLRLPHYTPASFWLVIICTTTLGTEISDFLDRSLRLGYALGSLLLASGLTLTLLVWYKRYRNVEVFPVTERPKEVLYWTAILFSNSLGTAFGDYLGDGMGLSYTAGAMVTGSVILIVILAHYLTRISHVTLFWIAFVFTRPFGATFGDFLTKPVSSGGLQLGTLNASVVALGVMAILVFMEHRRSVKLSA
jgi:uncharacterized membrane-anchored protein